jgi:uncharacterized membrane protein
MTNLLLASLFLPLSHFLISSTRLRVLLVRGLGDKLYSLAYSLLAFVALIWLIMAYRQAPTMPLWYAPHWLRVFLTPVILISGVFVVAGLTTPNPVIVRSARLFDRPEIVRGILRVTRNPLFWGVGIFAIAHVIITGDVAGMLAFGNVAFLSFAGGPILDAKKAKAHGRSWDTFAEATSDVPFLAIVQGRQRLAVREIGFWRLALSIAPVLIGLLFHRTLLAANLAGIAIVIGVIA